jgi:6-phosphogluconate dehydrogenase
MQLGMVGLGRMGANLTRRLMRDGHEVVVYDVNADSVSLLEGEGSIGTGSLEDFVSKLSKPRAAWVMVPAAFAEQTTAPNATPRKACTSWTWGRAAACSGSSAGSA